MVYRVFVERKPSYAQEAQGVYNDLHQVLGVTSLTGVRVFNRYDVEHIDEELFIRCRTRVFSEMQTDDLYDALPIAEAKLLAVEYLPGQFDMRSAAAEECIRLLCPTAAPTVRTARVYMLTGALNDADMAAIRRQLINPVECREASMDAYETLTADYPDAADVPTIEGFLDMDDAALGALRQSYGLAMDEADVHFTQAFFRGEGRCPTETELRVLDTYWSDHCRHTTFQTELTEVASDDALALAAYKRYRALRRELGVQKPETLMDMATIGAKYLKHTGMQNTDESAEINACTVKTRIEADGRTEPWLLLFKNETHNHPTEIEPFGGAATCLGGAIRDPLSGRGYVYQAMRISGAADPRKSAAETLQGKLSQRKIVTAAAAGYSSYGNQIGLSTGLVNELYHEGYAAKHMEIGAVIAAVPEQNVRREEPTAGDVVLLLGGRTGRDGCGGATGSSKAHTVESIHTCGAEVQKGNAPEERKLQRLFRNPAATQLIKRCNDFGAGGVCVAIGELAEGLRITLDAVPRKYEGLNGTELAISESQERMAVVVSPADAQRLIDLAKAENLSATPVAVVTKEPRLVMEWRGKRILDIPRAFIDTNGARRQASVRIEQGQRYAPPVPHSFQDGMLAMAADLSFCSQRGLSERFDSTVGANTVLMPLGGKRQRTPAQAMVAKFPVKSGNTSACSVMAYGFDPYISSASPYIGAYGAVVSAVCKAVAAGAERQDCYLTLQEYFPKPAGDPARWGLPAAALLGALTAQLDLGVAAIGGKDSMSGSFEALDVPPTLAAFAVAKADAKRIASPEFKRAGARVELLEPAYDPNGLPVADSLKALLARVHAMIADGQAAAVYVPERGGLAEAVMKACLGNGLGFAFEQTVTNAELFAPRCGCFLVELTADAASAGRPIGRITESGAVTRGADAVALAALESAYEGTLEGIFPTNVPCPTADVPKLLYRGVATVRRGAALARPRVLIPVFPGTNCEYESARAVELAGGVADTMVVNTMSAADVQASVNHFAERLSNAQMLFLSGGFSGGDEPDGSGRLITAFLSNAAIAEELMRLIDVRDGLVCGICNGFQALIKLGLVPYGRFMKPSADAPTLTYNTIGRHQSRIVYTRVASKKSPWLSKAALGGVYAVPVSHGEGRFICPSALLESLIANGQIATQYCDAEGKPSMHIDVNPNGSVAAVEGITSPDGRVFGKMGHSERIGPDLYQNVPGRYDMGMFASAVAYFK